MIKKLIKFYYKSVLATIKMETRKRTQKNIEKLELEKPIPESTLGGGYNYIELTQTRSFVSSRWILCVGTCVR